MESALEGFTLKGKYCTGLTAQVPKEDTIIFLPVQRSSFLLKFRGLSQKNGGELMSTGAVRGS